MRYLTLWFSFFKMSWMADAEYRANFIIRIFGETGFYVAQLSVFEVLFTHANSISGWDVHGMRVFMGALFLVDCLYMIFLMESIENMPNLVKSGELDLYLAKPIDTQFMVSVRKVSTAYIVNLVLITIYLGWAIKGLPQAVSAWQVILFCVLLGMGSIAQYALRFMFNTLTVILQDAGNINYLWHQLFRLAMRPDPLYPFSLRVLIFTIFPVAFFASVPARVLVEGIDWRLLAGSFVLTSLTLYLSVKFWRMALRHYASASS